MTVKAVLTVIAEEYEVNIQGLETDISVEDDSDDSDDKDDKAYLYTVIIIILFIGILDSSRRRNS